MFNILLGFCVLLELNSIAVNANDYTATTQADHLVFLIHGVGGNTNSFGKMQQALTQHLNSTNKLGKVIVIPFQYDTANDQLGIDDFAKQFNDFIVSHLEIFGHEKSTVSVVAHSQGGLVTTTLYYKSYLNADGFDNKLSKKIKNVVTLGTPFWGSKVATLVENHPDIFVKLKNRFGDQLGPVGTIGKNQVLDMALGSKNTQRFRRNLMRFTKEELETVFSNVHVLNIHGNANLKRLALEAEKKIQDQNERIRRYKFDLDLPNLFSLLLPFVYGVTEYEADGIVSVPSSTLNTIYIKDLSQNYEEGDWLRSEDFSELAIAERLIVRAVHASSKPELIYDLSYIPQECVKNSQCHHPTYSFILNYLINNTIPHQSIENSEFAQNKLYVGPKVDLNNFGGFTLDVNIRMPEGYEDLRDKVKVAIYQDSRIQKIREFITDRKSKIPKTTVSRFFEFYSQVQQETREFPDSVMSWHTGHVIYTGLLSEDYDFEFRKNGTKIRLSISAPGMKKRNIEAKVKPTLSTYIDVILAPKNIKNNRLNETGEI